MTAALAVKSVYLAGSLACTQEPPYLAGHVLEFAPRNGTRTRRTTGVCVDFRLEGERSSLIYDAQQSSDFGEPA